MAEGSWAILGKGRAKANGIARRENEGEDKMNSKKGTDLKVLSITQWIMSAHRKDKMGILNVFGDGKVTHSGATQAIS